MAAFTDKIKGLPPIVAIIYIFTPVKRVLLIVSIGLISFMPQTVTVYGVVERQMGIGIYICSVPARDFDTVCVFKTRKDFNSYPGPSIPQYVEGIQKPVDDLAKQA